MQHILHIFVFDFFNTPNLIISCNFFYLEMGSHIVPAKFQSAFCIDQNPGLELFDLFYRVYTRYIFTQIPDSLVSVHIKINAMSALTEVYCDAGVKRQMMGEGL